MIERDPSKAAGASYDLVVVGGGVYGVALALEAARRGFRPLLLEQRDFGGATSWNSLRTVHGGLRYLQTMDLHRFRESVGERRWWLRFFPDLVEPLPCLMPLYGAGLHRPSILRIALAVNDALSRNRNRSVRADRALPRGTVLSAAETVRRFPGVDRDGLKGAALWYDAAIPDSQRLILEMLHWAVAAGAVALNYVEARRLLLDGTVAAGVEALDHESGAALEFRAPVVVNCAGPWCRDVAERFDRDLPELFSLSIAFNALIDREPLADAAVAVAPRVPGGRTYFLHPFKGKILAGTYHTGWRGTRDEGRVDGRMLGLFLRDLNLAVPGWNLDRDEVLRAHWGFLPAVRPGSDRLAVREVIRHHGDLGGPDGLFSLSGVKFTTARLVALKVLRSVSSRRGEDLPPPGDAPRPEPTDWPPAGEIEGLLLSDPDTAASRIRSLHDEEAVLHLDDLMLRRTDWGIDPARGRILGKQIATRIGWSPARAESEIERLARFIV